MSGPGSAGTTPPGPRRPAGSPASRRARACLPLLLAATLLLPGPAAGDDYPLQPGVDVQRYVFGLRLQDGSDRIVGDARIEVRFRAAGVRELFLDLVGDGGSGMRVESVDGPDGALEWRHRDDRVHVALARPSRAGEIRTLRVRYSGVPGDGLVIAANLHGDRTFFGDNWPDRARHWLPTVDHVSDKARVEFRVVAPERYQVVTNGRLVEETDLEDGSRLTRWATDAPLPTKVMVVGVARFAVRRTGRVAGVPLSTWVYPQDAAEAPRDLDVAARVVEFLVSRVGPFPFAGLAGVQSRTRYGGMENAGAIFYSESAIAGDRDVEGLVAHEVAHQWFGDAVTEADWHHVWLSEGFATYFTQLYMEAVHGRDRMEAGLRAARDRVLEYAAEHPGSPVVDEAIRDLNRLLNANSYQKGGWVLHMLRRRVGDAAFWRGIRSYYRRHRDGNALTADFRRAMEEAAGQDLADFFEQWVFRPGHPRLAGSWSWNPEAGSLSLTVEQRQPEEPFRFPLDLAIRLRGGGTARRTVEMESRRRRVEIPLESAPTAVEPDPDVWLLFEDAGFRSHR